MEPQRKYLVEKQFETNIFYECAYYFRRLIIINSTVVTLLTYIYNFDKAIYSRTSLLRLTLGLSKNSLNNQVTPLARLILYIVPGL